MTQLETTACRWVHFVTSAQEGDGDSYLDRALLLWGELVAAVEDRERLILPDMTERNQGEDCWVGLEELGDLARLRY